MSEPLPRKYYGLKLESLFLVGENYIITIKLYGWSPKWVTMKRREILSLRRGGSLDGEWTMISVNAGTNVVEFQDGDRVMTVDRYGWRMNRPVRGMQSTCDICKSNFDPALVRHFDSCEQTICYRCLSKPIGEIADPTRETPHTKGQGSATESRGVGNDFHGDVDRNWDCRVKGSRAGYGLPGPPGKRLSSGMCEFESRRIRYERHRRTQKRHCQRPDPRGPGVRVSALLFRGGAVLVQPMNYENFVGTDVIYVSRSNRKYPAKITGIPTYPDYGRSGLPVVSLEFRNEIGKLVRNGRVAPDVPGWSPQVMTWRRS